MNRMPRFSVRSLENVRADRMTVFKEDDKEIRYVLVGVNWILLA
jgi:hypothetical protein